MLCMQRCSGACIDVYGSVYVCLVLYRRSMMLMRTRVGMIIPVYASVYVYKRVMCIGLCIYVYASAYPCNHLFEAVCRHLHGCIRTCMRIIDCYI